MALLDHLYYLKDLARSKTTRAFSLVIVANFLVTVIGFVSSILVFRTQDTAVIAILYPLVGLFLFLDQFSDFGLTVSYIRYASADLNLGQENFRRTTNATLQAHTALATIVVCAVIFCSSFISKRLFQTEIYSTWVSLAALCTWFYALSNFLQSILQAQGNFRRLAWARIIPNLVKALALVVLALSGKKDLSYLFFAFLVSPSLSIFVMLPALDLKIFRFETHSRAEFLRLFDFSKWIFFSAVAVSCISQLDLFMLRSLAPDQEVVRYLGGQRLASILPLLISSLVTILLPKISSYRHKSELRFYLKKVFLFSPIIFVLILSFSFLAPWVIPLALGAKYQSSVGIFQAYCWVYALDTVVTLASLVFYNLNLVSWFSGLNIVQLALNYGLNLLLIPRFGAMGACFSAGLIRLAGIPMLLYLASRESILTSSTD